MLLLLLASCRANPAAPFHDDGCGPLADPIVESNRFTSYEDVRSRPEMAPILAQPGAVGPHALPRELRMVSDILDGLPIVAAFVNPDLDAASEYFLDRPLTDFDTLETVLVDGGVYLDRQLSGNPGENFAIVIANELRDRAVVVKLGTSDAALVWADPDRMGIRVHNLMWSDTTHIYRMAAVRSPERIVGMGRAVVCHAPDPQP